MALAGDNLQLRAVVHELTVEAAALAHQVQALLDFEEAAAVASSAAAEASRSSGSEVLMSMTEQLAPAAVSEAPDPPMAAAQPLVASTARQTADEGGAGHSGQAQQQEQTWVTFAIYDRQWWLAECTVM